MKFIAIASLGFAAVVAAQNSTDCVSKDNACRGAPEANMAQCAADNAQCQGDCYADYNTCRVAPEANHATCAANYAGCLGENPFSSDGTLTVIPITASTAAATSTTSATSSTATAVSTAACEAEYDSCRGAPDANFSYCASQYAQCLNTNPFASNGTNTVTGNAASAVYTTEVVTAYTTYCPASTTVSMGGKVYTVSSATTLTITDCPCTITKASTMPIATGNATLIASASGAKNATATHSMMAYTGAAAHFGAGSGLVAALAGAAILI